MSGRRAALRVARRTAWRNRKRTFFLTALIGVPVALAVIVAGVMRASELTPEESAQATFGDADYRIQIPYSPEADEWISSNLADIDPNAEVVSYHRMYGRLAKRAYGSVLDVDTTAAMGKSFLMLIAGAAPTGDAQVAVTPDLAELLDARIGDTIQLELGATKQEGYELVGLVRPPIVEHSPMVLVSPERFDALVGEPSSPYAYNVMSTWLVAGDDPTTSAAMLQQRWDEDEYRFWPSTAVVPKPPALDFMPNQLYAFLDQAQVHALLGMETGANQNVVIQAAYKMVDESNVAFVVLPDLNVGSRAVFIESANSDLLSSPPVIGTGIAALILVEVAFIAAAAFAAGTRRRLREIGLLGANGADTRHIRLTVIGEGFTAGLLGATAGVALGYLLLLFGSPILRRFAPTFVGGVDLNLADVLGPALVAVAASVIAAWVPARTASKIPTAIALQGRMPARSPRPWVAPLGAGMAGFGGLLLVVALTAGKTLGGVVAVIGSLLMVSGVALLAGPVVAWVSCVANRVRSTPRLVLRDSGRHRTRASVAVAATMVILLAPALSLTIQKTYQERALLHGLPNPGNQVLLIGRYDGFGYFGSTDEPITDADIAELASIVPVDKTAVFSMVNVSVQLKSEVEQRQSEAGSDITVLVGGGQSQEWGAAIANDDLVDALGRPEVGEVLAADGTVVLGVEDRDSWFLMNGERYQARELAVPLLRSGVPRVLLSESMAAGLGKVKAKPLVLFTLTRPLTSDEQKELAFTGLNTRGGWSDLTQNQIFLIVIGATLIAVLIVIALVTAVAAAEIKEEMEVIVAVGAPGSIRRRFLGIQSWLYTALAALLAVPLAIGTVKIFGLSQDSYYSGPFGVMRSSKVVTPWLGIGFLVLVLPLIVGLLTALVTRSSPVTPPRRAT